MGRMIKMGIGRATTFLCILASVLATSGAFAQTSRVATTKHNLSASGTAENRAVSEQEVCVFCHTPHASNTAAPAPLWNRSATGLEAVSYTPYTSTSLDAEYISGVLGAPGVTSKLCLSCHDGTVAVGQVSNAPGSGGLNGQISMTAGNNSVIGAGAGATTGFTRRLGTDLTNDHPISMTFNSTLAARDGELRTPPYTSGTLIVDNKGTLANPKKPKLPLDSANQVQCTTCHEPHFAEPKFLRGKRLQVSPATGGNYTDGVDQICLACHDKLQTAWSNSAHAKGTTGGGAPLAANPADARYKDAAAALREFPAGTTVWQAGCLNCHDTHTVQGARRLLREGTDGAGNGTTTARVGGSAALENTCYQCHQAAASSAIDTLDATLSASTGVPNIESEFARTGSRMPIATANQPAAAEAHNIGFNAIDPDYKTASVNCLNNDSTNKCGADFLEPRSRLGADNHSNRHVECTDCHNPHRVIKNSRFNGTGDNTRRTHVPADGATGNEGNVASGALRGTWGVEPTWTVESSMTPTTWWPEAPSAYRVVRGDPGPGAASIARSSTYLTREYQLCFKCHSDYGAGATMPLMTNTTGTTTSGTNGIGTRWTNVAAEFAARAADPPESNLDQGESTNSGGPCAGANCTPSGTYPRDTNSGGGSDNHRSWHPVVWPTGRNLAERGGVTAPGNFRSPFNTNGKIGTQTMHCSDCHGQATSWTDNTTTGGPALNQVQGPHGSDDVFLLKGPWGTGINLGNPATSLCGNCHPMSNSAFNSNHRPGNAGGKMNSLRCVRCHIAIPHGWKNKAFLVNRYCLGPEDGGAACRQSDTFTTDVDAPPYYLDARNGFLNWQPSGSGQYNNEANTCNRADAGTGSSMDKCAEN